MSFFEFPHTRTYDSDLGWLIKKIGELIENITSLFGWKAEHEQQYATLRSDVDNIIGGTLSLLTVRKYAFIGDSWIQSGEMMRNLATITGLDIGTDIFYSGSGGAGFTIASTTGQTFGEQVQTVLAAVNAAGVDPTTITDVVFMGGINDSGATDTEIIRAGNAAVASAKATFPNAEIWVMPLTTNAIASGRANIIQNVISGYSQIDAHYCTKAPYVIHALTYLQSDNIHPNADGMTRCAYYVRNAIINKSDTMPARRFGQGITAASGVALTGHTFWTWEDGTNIFYSIPSFQIDINTEITINNAVSIDIGTFAVGGLDILPNVATNLMQKFKTQVLLWNSAAATYRTIEAELRFGLNANRLLTVTLYIERGQSAFGTTANRFVVLGGTGNVMI